MPITLSNPDTDGLTDVVRALHEWQQDGEPVPLHPGDLGWHWRLGAAATAATIRLWSRDGDVVAVGFVDGPGLLRLAVGPEFQRDPELTERLVEDLSRPEPGLLPEGEASIEARFGGPLRELLVTAGWQLDEPWTPLLRDLTAPVPDCGLRVQTTGPQQAGERVAVHRASFDRSTFTEDSWRAMAAGPAYAEARCLVGHDAEGNAVATATVWSAGPGRPGLLEPVGVHREHRGHGYGRAITLAAAAALHELGSSSAVVCTPSANVGAVATYQSAGFSRFPDVCDLRRPA